MSTDPADPVDGQRNVISAWFQYKQFEELTFSSVEKTDIDKKSESQDSDSGAERFLVEFERRATAAKAAGCAYTDSVLAFKLLEKCRLNDDDIVSFLSSVPSLLLDEPKPDSTTADGKPSLVRSSRSKLRQSGPTVKPPSSELLLSVVKIFIKNLDPHEDPFSGDVNESDVFDGDDVKREFPNKFNDTSEFISEYELTSEDRPLPSTWNKFGADGDHMEDDDLGHDREDDEEDAGDDADLSDSFKDYPLNGIKMEGLELHPLNGADDTEENGEDANGEAVELQCKDCEYTTRSAHRMRNHTVAKHSSVTCGQCSFTTVGVTQLRNHEKKVHGDDSAKCNECGEKFPSWMAMIAHKSEAHADDTLFACNQCDRKFPHQSSLRHHRKRVHEAASAGGGGTFNCPECDKVFKNSSLLHSHRRIVHKRLQCELCQKDFTTLTILKQHMRNIHEGFKYTCDLCHKGFAMQTSLRIHQRTIHDGIWLSCDDCGKKFATSTRLKRHKVNTHNEDPLTSRVCDKCGKSYKNAQAFYQHKRKVHDFRKYYSCQQCDYAGKDSVDLRAHVTLKHEGKKLPCPECAYQANSLVSFYQHKAKHKNKVIVKNEDGTVTFSEKKKPVKKEKSFSCDECGLVFQYKSSMLTHKQSKHQGITYKCDICGATLLTKLTLKKHITLMHGNAQHICDVCGYVSKSKDFLKDHVRRVHEKRYKSPCLQCSHVAPSITELRIHVQTKHEGIKYPCDRCDYQAPHPKYLKRHKEINHEMKRYHCNQCDYSAKDKQLLKIHMETKHQGVLYPCDGCEMKFTTKPALKKHKKTNHMAAANSMYVDVK